MWILDYIIVSAGDTGAYSCEEFATEAEAVARRDYLLSKPETFIEVSLEGPF